MGNSWVCVDACLVVRVVLGPADSPFALLWDEWAARGQSVAAPLLLRYEVTNALYRYERQGVLSPLAVQLAHAAALALPITLLGDALQHQRALQIARQLGLSATYDAHYLALAEQLGAELWTADRRLAEAVREGAPWVRLAV
jgi:predicted nucleic acid-binding protein